MQILLDRLSARRNSSRSVHPQGEQVTATNRLRVVVHTDSAGIGGAEISLGHLVAHVSDRIEITVVGVSQPVVDAIASRRSTARRIVLPAKGMLAIAAHLRTFLSLRPDVIHVNLCTPWAGATGLAAALALPGARVVRVDQLPLRTTDLGLLLRTRMLCLRLDAQVAVGEASARRMEDFYALGRGTVRSVINGVPDVECDRVPRLPLTPGRCIIGCVGRLDAMKGYDVLLRAIALVEGTEVAILGEGVQRQALEDLAQTLGVRDRVRFCGWVESPRAYLPQFDLFTQPSRSEGFPLAIVEAMLAARPVVATRVGSVAEAVKDNETGLLVDKDDVNGLAAAIRRLRDNPALRERLGRRGREIALAHFTAQQMADRYERLWEEIVAQPQVPRLRVPRPKD